MEIGAVNTLWFEDGVLWGGNTDAYGFVANLDAMSPGWDERKTALVFGAGGASRAVVYALKQRGFTDIRIVNRTVERAKELADRLGSGVSAHQWRLVPELLKGSALIVNTTSLGMEGKDVDTIDLAGAASDALVTDIVYAPLDDAPAESGSRAWPEDCRWPRHAAAPGGARFRALVRSQAGCYPRTARIAPCRHGQLRPRRSNQMIVLGLTGSIGMGKSTSAQMFVDEGIPVYSADEAVHRLYSGAAAPLIEEAFPGTTKDGKVDRTKLSAAVMGKPDKLKQLESIIHPLVRAEENSFREAEQVPGCKTDRS